MPLCHMFHEGLNRTLDLWKQNGALISGLRQGLFPERMSSIVMSRPLKTLFDSSKMLNELN